MAGRKVVRGKGPGGRGPKGRRSVSTVPVVSLEEEAFGSLAGRFLEARLHASDPDLTMHGVVATWKRHLSKTHATKGLLVTGPYQFVQQFRGIVEDPSRNTVGWLVRHFSYEDWKRAVQWCGIEKIFSLFASRQPPDEEGSIHSKLQEYGLDFQERNSLRFGWLLKILKFDKAHGKLGGLERDGILTRKDVTDEFKGLTWLRRQKAEWRWLVLLLQTAKIKPYVDIPTHDGVPPILADDEAKSRIWSTVAVTEGVLNTLPWASTVGTDPDSLNDAYRAWWLGRAVKCEIGRMLELAQAGSETLEISYPHQDRRETFKVVQGDFSRRKADDYIENLVKEVGKLLPRLRIDGKRVEEWIEELRRWGDGNDVYQGLVFPTRAGAAKWGDRDKLINSPFADYLPEAQRLALIGVLAGIVQEATQARELGKFERARKTLRHLKGKKLDPAELAAVKAFVAGDIGEDELEGLLSPTLHGVISLLRGLRDGDEVAVGVTSIEGSQRSLKGTVLRGLRARVDKFGQGFWDFFEEHPGWVASLSILPVFLLYKNLGWEVAIPLTVVSWFVVRAISKSRYTGQ